MKELCSHDPKYCSCLMSALLYYSTITIVVRFVFFEVSHPKTYIEVVIYQSTFASICCRNFGHFHYNFNMRFYQHNCMSNRIIPCKSIFSTFVTILSTFLRFFYRQEKISSITFDGPPNADHSRFIAGATECFQCH